VISGHYCLCFGGEWENWKTGNEAENVDEVVGEKRSAFGYDNHRRELEVSSPLDYEVYLRMSPCMFGKLTEMLHLKSDRALVDLLLPAV
jgi:hypothetical protein